MTSYLNLGEKIRDWGILCEKEERVDNQALFGSYTQILNEGKAIEAKKI